jgi:purine-nucleoside/S-methyl-5'-thioadenosine phosphorylase / adenosine deaminase
VKTSAPSNAAAQGIGFLQAWDSPALCHGFLGRGGGVSTGTYATLNLGYHIADSPAAVDENWRRVRDAIDWKGAVARVIQVHGNVVHTVTPENAAALRQGDGMVTAHRGIVLRVLSADCVPILLHDAHSNAVGALHAGWRGAIAGIAQAGVHAMTTIGASAGGIRAALGPSIGQCCFEVDAELAGRFAREVDGAAAHSRAGRPGKAYLDLRAIIADQLAAAGLARESISSVGPCTRCASDRYFSRRAAGGVVTGLQASFIAMRE